MIHDLKERLRAYSLHQLEEMLHYGATPDFIQDRQVFLAVLIDVIKEKRAALFSLDINPR